MDAPHDPDEKPVVPEEASAVPPSPVQGPWGPPPAQEGSFILKFADFLFSLILTIVADLTIAFFSIMLFSQVLDGFAGSIVILIAILLLNVYVAFTQIRKGHRYTAYGIVAALCFFLLAAGGCIMAFHL